jgi:hypothetical protein
MTRWLVAVLLLFNFLAVAWMFDVARQSTPAQAARSDTAAAQGGEEIRLVSEAAPAAATAAASTLEATAAAQAAAGPEPTEAVVQQAPPTEAPIPATTPDTTISVAVVEPPASPAAVPAAAPEPEPENGPATATAAEPGPAPAATPASLCVSFGPFEDLGAIDRLETWVRNHGGSGIRREVDRPEITQNWLYLGPWPSRTEAQLEYDRLRELGLQDLLAVRHEELGHVVSLGLYSTREGMERRLKQLQAVGVDPIIKPRYAHHAQHWLDARWTGDSGLDAAVFTGLADPGLMVAGDCQTTTAASLESNP